MLRFWYNCARERFWLQIEFKSIVELRPDVWFDPGDGLLGRDFPIVQRLKEVLLVADVMKEFEIFAHGCRGSVLLISAACLSAPVFRWPLEEGRGRRIS